MNAYTIKTDAEKNLMEIAVYGAELSYSPATDARVLEVIDGKINCCDEEAAEGLAREIRAWGCPDAQALGCSVVFYR